MPRLNRNRRNTFTIDSATTLSASELSSATITSTRQPQPVPVGFDINWDNVSLGEYTKKYVMDNYVLNNSEREEEAGMTKEQKYLAKLRRSFGEELEFTDSHNIGTFCFFPNRVEDTISIEDLYLVYGIYSPSRVRIVRYDGNYGRIETDELRFFKPNNNTLTVFCREMGRCIDADWIDDSAQYAINVLQEMYSDVYNQYIHLPICAECGKPMIHRYHTFYGTEVCTECISTKYYSCNKCNIMLKAEDTEVCRNGSRLCPTCSKRNFVLPYHHFYPKIKFYGDSKANTEPYMGFELEVDFGGESSSNVAEIMPIINKAGQNEIFAYCSHDGSLNDGFEIITQPATLRYHQSIKGIYNDVAQKLKAMGYSSHDTSTCGFHVHVNRTYFGNKEEIAIERVILIVEKFWNEMCIFARRPERRMERYSKKRPTSISIEEYMERANKSGEHEWHYYAVNVANSDTIEFRMFKGTLNVNTIMATLNLVENICKVAKTKPADEINRMKFEDLLTTPLMRKYYARHACVPDFEE